MTAATITRRGPVPPSRTIVQSSQGGVVTRVDHDLVRRVLERRRVLGIEPEVPMERQT